MASVNPDDTTFPRKARTDKMRHAKTVPNIYIHLNI